MKQINIQYIPALEGITAGDKLAELITKSVMPEQIDQVNWPDAFPAKPQTEFYIARSDKALYIHFIAQEKQIKAIYSQDQDPVWQDSCVEFFCKIPGNENYFNFEFNCIGTCLSTERRKRNEHVMPISPKQMALIQRYPSLGTKTFAEKQGNFTWSLTVVIPFEILKLEIDNLPDTITANFYKCGDGTSVPHYVSWNPIKIEKPDFHRPDFFGKLKF